MFDATELHNEFENDATTDERRAVIVVEMQKRLEEYYNPDASHYCTMCRKIKFYAPHTHSVAEGHINSENGLAFANRTGICEFCFFEYV